MIFSGLCSDSIELPSNLGKKQKTADLMVSQCSQGCGMEYCMIGYSAEKFLQGDLAGRRNLVKLPKLSTMYKLLNTTAFLGHSKSGF